MMLDWNGFAPQTKQDGDFVRNVVPVFFFERLGGSNISIAAGMLDSSKGLKTVEHIFVDDKPDYYEIEDDLPKFSQYYKRQLESDT